MSRSLKTVLADDYGIDIDETSQDIIVDKIQTTLEIETQGSSKSNVTTVNSGTYNLATTDFIVDVTYTATAAVTSLTLPTAQTTSGRIIVVKDSGGNASANNITIDTEGSETIDGSATYVIDADYESINLYSNGSNWFIY